MSTAEFAHTEGFREGYAAGRAERATVYETDAEELRHVEFLVRDALGSNATVAAHARCQLATWVNDRSERRRIHDAAQACIHPDERVQASLRLLDAYGPAEGSAS